MRSPGSAPSALRQWLRLLAEGEVKPRSFVAPALLMLFASALEGLSIALLVPTLAGLLERDFTGLTRFPGLDLLHQRRPDLFAPGDTTLLPALLVTIAAVVLLKVIVFFRARLLFATKALRLADTWRQRLVRRYLGLGKRFFDEHNAGYLQSIILTHASQLGQAASTFGLALNHAMTIAIFGALMLWLSWQLTLLVVALFPLLYFSLSRLVRRIKSQSEHMWRAQRSLSELTFNLLTCVPLVKAYHQERREGDRFA
ncbi:MAG: hypothetical protein KIT58_15270, partial [Planctomycetota bacterium]|nr:hypothetical protein [Planctomycetota bacterium]